MTRDAIALADAVLGDALGGRGRLVAVTGEVGSGKTVFCDAVAARAVARGVYPVVGRAYIGDGARPLAPVADAVRNDRRTASSAAWQVAAREPDLFGPYLPELSAGRGQPIRDTHSLFERLLDAMEGVGADGGGALWILDDLHWADALSVRLVEYAARRLPRMRMALVVSLCEQDVAPGHPLLAMLAGLSTQSHVVQVHLTQPDGDPATTDATSAIRLALQRRLLRLDPRARRLLAVCVTAGPEASRWLLARVAGAPAAEVDDALDRMGHLGLVRTETRDGEVFAVACSHAVLDAAQTMLTGCDRAALHAAIATTLAQRDDAAVERVAHHLEAAHRTKSALDVLVQSAQRSRSDGELGRAASLMADAHALVSRHVELRSARHGVTEQLVQDLFDAERWHELVALVDSRAPALASARIQALDTQARALLPDAADRRQGATSAAPLKVLSGPAPTTAARRGRLSKREMEVAGLVAHGLSNSAIARRLLVSERTVASHISHVLGKLDFSSRTQIAAWVVEARVAAF